MLENRVLKKSFWCKRGKGTEGWKKLHNEYCPDLHSLPNIITYLLIPRSRVPLAKLTSFQLVKKFPTFYGAQRFSASFTRPHHQSLFSARSIQFMSPLRPHNPTSFRSFLILSSHLCLCLSSGLFHSGFPTTTLHAPLPSPIPDAPPISFFLI